MVIAWIDLTGLLPVNQRIDAKSVLSGIAHDSQQDRLFVTGKQWPTVFEIKISLATTDKFVESLQTAISIRTVINDSHGYCGFNNSDVFPSFEQPRESRNRHSASKSSIDGFLFCRSKEC